MLMTTVFSASSGMYTVGQGILSTVSLKKVFTPRRDVLINGKDFKVILMIISRTSLFKNCPVYPDPIVFKSESVPCLVMFKTRTAVFYHRFNIRA